MDLLWYRLHPNQHRDIFWRFGVGSKPCVFPFVQTENPSFPNVFPRFQRKTCVFLVFSICFNKKQNFTVVLHRNQGKRFGFTMVLQKESTKKLWFYIGFTWNQRESISFIKQKHRSQRKSCGLYWFSHSTHRTQRKSFCCIVKSIGINAKKHGF